MSQGCKDALPPRHSIGKHHDESLFFVKIAPSSSPGRQMEDFVSVFLRMRCDNVDCPIFYDEMKHLVQRDDLDSELRYAQERSDRVGGKQGEHRVGDARLAVQIFITMTTFVLL